MKMNLELEPETEARIRAAAGALGITGEQYAAAFIENYLKASEAGHPHPGLEADRLIQGEFSKT
jgi:hypothetical protein